MSTYSEKLRDPRWQKLRLEVMGRDEFKCRHCRSGDKTLHVHHVNYLRGSDPWDYPPRNFITLCEECHARLESRIAYLRTSLAASPSIGLKLSNVASILAGDGPFDGRLSLTLGDLLTVFDSYQEACMAPWDEEDGEEVENAIEAARASINAEILDFAGRIRNIFDADVDGARINAAKDRLENNGGSNA